jgi:cytidylate kinase
MRIALCGKICAGKTHVAKLLANKYNLEIFSFAAKIKEIAKDLFSMKTKDRKLLQQIGDKMREIDENIWIKFLIKQIEGKNNIVIDDLRLQNELDVLKKNGFTIIRLNIDLDTQLTRLRDIYPETYKLHQKRFTHRLETSVNNLTVDYDILSDDKTIENIAKLLL